MAKPYPEEFRRNVVAVARRGETPLVQISEDVWVLERLIPQSDEEGRDRRRDQAAVTSTKARDLKRQNRPLEQEAEARRRAEADLASCEVCPQSCSR